MKIYSVTLLICFTMFGFLSLKSTAEGTIKNDIPVTCASDGALQSFLSGREAFEMGRINDAKVFFDQATRSDSQFALAFLYKSYLSKSDAEWKENIEKAALNRNHISEGEKILIEMETALSEKNSQKRFALAKKLVELYPSSSQARLILAIEYQAQKKFTKCRDLAIEAIQLNPDSPLGYRILGSSYLLNEPNDFSLAQKYMEKFAELRPNEATAQIAMGDVYRASQRLFLAANSYSNAIMLDPESDVAFSKRGYIWCYNGDLYDAPTDWQMAFRLARDRSKISWPNYLLISYLSPDGKFAAENNHALNEMNSGRNGKHPMEGEENDHYFCCTFVSMIHGVYVSPFQNLNECGAIQRELIKESKAPDPKTVAANIIFVEVYRDLMMGNYELAAQKAQEHAKLVGPDKNPRKLEVYNYMMGLINLKQKKYNQAIEYYLKSDTHNACVKFELATAYDRIGNWEEAQALYKDISQFNFTSAAKSYMTSLSEIWLKSYASATKEE